MVLEKTLESPLDSKEIQPVHSELTAVTNSAGIELRIRVTAENDGFIDKQISVLTEDKKKINGYLRRLEPKGELYVEIH